MPVTITSVPGAKSTSGTIREEFYDIKFDSSYPTGGEPIIAKDFGLLSLYGVSVVGGNTDAMPYRVAFNMSTSKLYVETEGEQVAADFNLSAVTVRVRVTGI